MAEEAQFSPDATTTNKRKYDDTEPPRYATRRPTGFSAPIVPTPSSDQSRDAPPPPSSYNTVPPPADDIQIAKQRAQEIAARLSAAAAAGAGVGVGALDAKRSRVDNGSGFDADKGFSSGSVDVKSQFASAIPPSYGSHGSSKKIDIPNERVGVIIGRSGDTIKYLQLQSGAKIQVTRDTEADPHSVTRPVELMGTPEQISKAEQLIREVLAEAEQGGSGVVSRRLTGQAGSEQFVMKIPDNKVGLVIGKGGETIKNMQASSGARIQVIPLRKPPGDMSTERTVQIDGTSEQIEAAKQLVNEVISGENRLRNPTMAGGYSQQGYQARPPTSWGPGAPQMQQPGYGYVQPGSYPGPSPQYNMGNPSYPYSQPTSGGYSANWDQSTAPPTQQPSQGSGYDYYNQQAPTQQQTPGGSAQAGDNAGYNYSQPPATGYGQQGQGYAQDGYGGYQAPPPNSGYGQPPYDQHQTYNSAAGYGTAANPSQEVQTSTYGAQGDSSQAPPAGQPPVGQGYTATQQPSPNPASYPQGYGATPAAQAGYGNLPSAQSGYGPGYGMPQTQKSAYGQQPQQSPSNGSGYPQPSMQPGYPHSQPAAPSAYAQADSGAQHAPPSGYGAAQPGYGQPPYGATPVAQPGYGQAPPPYGSYGSAYSQTPQVYAAADANAGGSTPASQTNQQGGVAKASPQS